MAQLPSGLVDRLVLEIPKFRKYTTIEELVGGFSTEEKYIIHYADGSKNILCVSSDSDYHRKKLEHKLLKALLSTNVKCPVPLVVGLLKEMKRTYSVYSYIDGHTAEKVLGTYENNVQYTIGFEAGGELRKMHKLPASQDIGPWHNRRKEKYLKYYNEYKTCGIMVRNEDSIVNYINENIYISDGRLNSFQHDDFHLGNIIIKNQHYAGVIDFNRYDWGDPIHDFYKLPWFTKGKSIPFSMGQIHGYYDNKVPESFWTLYSLYLAMSIFASIVWCLRRFPERIRFFLDTIDTILEDHQNFTLIKPKWYGDNE